MKREELRELQNIVSISNMRSIMGHGILSHAEAERLGVRHESIANPSVQRVRRAKMVPGGLPLPQYACLYLNARNPMTYYWKERHAELCILRLDPAVLDLPGVVIADSNAARDLTRFWPAEEGLARVDRGLVFAERWVHENPLEKDRRKGIMCAEALVPHRVDPGFIVGAYVSCEQSRRVLHQLVPGLPLAVDPYRFFQRR